MKLAESLILLIEKKEIPPEIKNSENLMAFVKKMIGQMKWEIEQSEKGERKYSVDPNDYRKRIYTGRKSTFPKYLQRIFNGKGTRKKFLDAVKRGKGPVWTRIALEAIDRLKHGFQNDHGYDGPNKDFLSELKDPTPF